MGLLYKLLPGSITTFIKKRELKNKYPDVSFGDNCTIFQSRLGRHVNIASDVTILSSSIGDYSYIGPGAVFSNITMGSYCSIAPQVFIGLGSHPAKKFVSTHPVFYLRRPEAHWSFADKDYLPEFSPTRIGNDVWIGVRAAIRDGVTVGDGAIIGAGSVVVKDIPPYTIWGGVPARQIRQRFTPEEIEFLLKFRWWEKEESWIKENFRKFHDIAELMKESP